MKIIPLKNRVLAKRKEAETVTKSGLIIPSSALSNEAEVLAVGPGRVTESGTLVPMDIAPGNIVMFSKYAETEVHINGETFLILHENDIMTVIE